MLLAYLMVAVSLAFVGLIVFMVHFFGIWPSDEGGAMFGALIFFGAWFWPVLLPLALIGLVIAMIMHICIMFEWMVEPEWWPTR